MVNTKRSSSGQWSGRDVLQAISSTPFLRSGVHGIAGIALIALCVAEIARFSRTLTPSYPMALSIFVAAFSLVIGLLEKQYVLRLRKMSKQTGMNTIWIRAGGLNLAFASLAISWYANAQVAPLWNGGALLVGTVGAVSALATSWIDVRRRTIARGTITATLTAGGVILVVPVLHACLGHTNFVELTKIFPIRESVHIVMICSTLVNAWDSFMIGLATTGRISYDTLHAVAIIDWAVTYSTLMFVFMWMLWGIVMALVTFLFLFGCYAMSTPLEKLLIGTGQSPFVYKGESNLDYFFIVGASTLVAAVACYWHSS